MVSRNINPELIRSDPDRLLNENDAAMLLGYTTRALQNWRLRGGGPVFVKVSDRSVRYRHRDLLAWIEQRSRATTSDPGSGRGSPATPAAHSSVADAA